MHATTVLKQYTFNEISLKAANKTYAKVRAMIGLKETAGSWFTPPNANVKFTHTVERYTYGLSLMPAQSGRAFCLDNGFEAAAAALDKFNVCPHSTPMCRQGCLATAGKGCMSDVQAGRTARTLLWAIDPHAAYTLTCHHIRRVVAKHGAENVAIRLNTLSDIRWEVVLPPAFWQEFADVQFYDYTKAWGTYDRRALLPENYHLTVSASERMSVDAVRDAVQCGVNVAVVIGQHADAPKPATWAGLPVVDGNATDARYLDPQGGHVVLLGALGKAKALPVGERAFVKPVRVA